MRGDLPVYDTGCDLAIGALNASHAGAGYLLGTELGVGQAWTLLIATCVVGRRVLCGDDAGRASVGSSARWWGRAWPNLRSATWDGVGFPW